MKTMNKAVNTMKNIKNMKKRFKYEKQSHME